MEILGHFNCNSCFMGIPDIMLGLVGGFEKKAIMIINFLLLNYFLTSYFMTYIPVYTLYNLSKSVRPFAFDNFSKNDGTFRSLFLIEILQRHWATHSLTPFFLSLCYLHMRINTLRNFYMFIFKSIN